MEPALALTWPKFDMEKRHRPLQDQLTAKTRKEKKRQLYRYEGTAQIKDRDSDYNFQRGFTL